MSLEIQICGVALIANLILRRLSTFAGQNLQNLDSLYAGKMLGHKSDISDGSLRGYEFRKFGNIVGDYCVSPRFLDAISVCLRIYDLILTPLQCCRMIFALSHFVFHMPSSTLCRHSNCKISSEAT